MSCRRPEVPALHGLGVQSACDLSERVSRKPHKNKGGAGTLRRLNGAGARAFHPLSRAVSSQTC